MKDYWHIKMATISQKKIYFKSIKKIVRKSRKSTKIPKSFESNLNNGRKQHLLITIKKHTMSSLKIDITNTVKVQKQKIILHILIKLLVLNLKIIMTLLKRTKMPSNTIEN